MRLRSLGPWVTTFALFFPLACSSSEPAAVASGADASTATDDASIDAGTDAAKATSSKGSGGVTCASQGDLGGGRSYCLGNEGGSEFKLLEPAPASGPLRLALYLHGDGAAAHVNDGAMKALLAWADAHHALFVSVLSPNRCAWWQAASQTDCSASATPVADTNGDNADALRAVIDKVRAGFDVSFGPAFYYGSSGGSIFLTKSFLRRFGDKYPGVFALNCGGEKASLALGWNTNDAALRGPTKLYFTYGDQDFLKPDIEKAIPYWTAQGFPVDTKVIAGAQHCAFDGHGRAREVWSAFLGE
ncbi:MAG: hypothetical protein JWM74_6269 [Myxococcaceae bacterium]|nr:hypothetical protein [Myxococcaceae bacterium]